MTDFEAHLTRQAAFSRATFGPGKRTAGVTDHIRKELIEVAQSDGSPEEWVDVAILALDGLLRSIAFQNDVTGWRSDVAAETAVQMIVEKQSKNELRNWPDWRTAAADKAIEHDRSAE